MKCWSLLLLPVAVAVLAACGESGGDETPVPLDKAAIEHVHGLGVNPADGALFVATHRGLFRSAKGETTARRVGRSQQDIMGFSVLGRDHFIGSGHPDATSDAPPLLGLIESKDAGQTWRSVVLEGEADFHAIEPTGGGFYAHDVSSGQLFHGAVGGSGVSIVPPPPGAVIDLAADPKRAERLFAATDRGLFWTRDQGRRWRATDRQLTGLIVHDGLKLVLVDESGGVHEGDPDGGEWRKVGAIGGAPAVLTASAGRLYAAVVDGPVVVSDDGGATWSVRVTG